MKKNLSIIMYHYVRELTHSRYPQIKGLDAGLFEQQLQFIKKNYEVIEMETLLRAVKSGDWKEIPPRAMLLTFDDGYSDHYTVVYPMLKKYHMQGSFFPNAKAVKEHKLLDVNKIHHILATAPVAELVRDCMDEMDRFRREGRLVVDGKELPSNEQLYKELAVANRWDPGDVIFVKRLLQNRLPEDVRGEITSKFFEKYMGISEAVFARELYMSREQIQVMKEGGMYFGLHGYDHYWLGKMSTARMQEDIQKALDFFSDVIDPDNWVMNYPYGNYSEDVIQYIQNNGCQLGLTVEARDAVFGKDDPYLFPRWDTNDFPPKSENYKTVDLCDE